MIAHSVLVPARSAKTLRPHLSPLVEALDLLSEPYEILVIDDGLAGKARSDLETFVGAWPDVRLVQLDRASGASAAVSAGIDAARGETIVLFPADGSYEPWQIGRLLAGLARGDLIWARQVWPAWQKWLRRLTRIPRWLLLGLEVRDPDCQFWAARREALQNLPLSRGMLRYLPTLVCMGGYRVCECGVAASRRSWRLPEEWPNPVDLLAVWWLKRRRRAFVSREATLRPAARELRLSA